MARWAGLIAGALGINRSQVVRVVETGTEKIAPFKKRRGHAYALDVIEGGVPSRFRGALMAHLLANNGRK